MLFIGLMSWLARQPPFSRFAIKKIFWSSEQLLFPLSQPMWFRWGWIPPAAEMGMSTLARTSQSAYSIFLRWLRIWRMTKSRQWDSFWDFSWNFWGRGDLFLLGHLSLLASLLAGGYLASCGHNFPRVRPAQRNAEPCRLPSTSFEKLDPVKTDILSPHFVNRQFFCVFWK